MSNNQICAVYTQIETINTICMQIEKALQELKIAIEKPSKEDPTNIDDTIQHFESSIELFFKLLKRILAEKKTMPQSPQDILRQAYAAKLIDNETTWLAMLQDRNFSSCTYNEDLAREIYTRIKTYYPLLKATLDNLKKKYLKTREMDR